MRTIWSDTQLSSKQHVDSASGVHLDLHKAAGIGEVHLLMHLARLHGVVWSYHAVFQHTAGVDDHAIADHAVLDNHTAWQKTEKWVNIYVNRCSI